MTEENDVGEVDQEIPDMEFKDIVNDIVADKFVERRFPEHLNLPKPGGNDVLWRYMDFTQYVSIIENERLHFSRPDQFNDKFEGTLPDTNVNQRRDWAREIQLAEELRDRIDDITEEFQLDGDNKEELIDAYFERINQNMLRQTALNCWHKEPREKAAMWNIYGSSEYGVAVQTTFNDLLDSVEVLSPSHSDMNSDGDINEYLVGEVEYIDYRIESIPDTFVHPYFYKRDSFSNENEVRIAHVKIEEQNVGENGEYVDVGVESLVNEVRLEPSSPDWFEDLVRRITDSLGYDISINRSELEREPSF